MRRILDEQTYLDFNAETSLKVVRDYRAKYAWIDECLEANPRQTCSVAGRLMERMRIRASTVPFWEDVGPAIPVGGSPPIPIPMSS